ncbi:putative serine protease EDA2 [Acorus calamus]|uniref:Serine protease EDA2 n=1 Tax=Acorus calamus TaxID=4465 RepID=A0AAV9DRM9_ACOCL|nr:putative serine protease EDA2 [Acorus calamus]
MVSGGNRSGPRGKHSQSEGMVPQEGWRRYHLDLCKNVFGEGIYPDVDVTNIYYGGTKIAVPLYIIKCHNCGHGSDMRGCPQAPLNLEGNAEKCASDAVQKVRQQIINHIDLWLSQCQDTGPDVDEPDWLGRMVM